MPAERQDLVPIWLENLAAFGWRLLVVVGLAIVLASIALTLISVTASLVLSAVIAAAVAPVVISLRARGWSRLRAALAGWFVVGGIIVLALALIVLAFVPAIRDVLGALQSGLDALKSGSGGVRLPPEMATAMDQAASGVTAWLKSALGELAGHVATTATIAVLSTFLTFFVLLDADHGTDWALQAVAEADRGEVRERGRVAAMRVGGLVRATAAAAAIRAGLMLAVMLALGTPLAGPLAAVLLVGGLIPYLGTLVATLLVLLVALGGQGVAQCAVLLGASVAIEIAIARAGGRAQGSGALRVHPAVALIALPIGAVAAGVIGMVLAVPVAAFLEQMTGTAIAAFEPGLPAISSRGPVVPGWLDRLAQWSWRLLIGIGLLVAFVVLTVQLSGAVLALVLAAVLAATLAPLAAALRRRGAGPTMAAVGAAVGLFAAIGVVLLLTIVSLARDIAQVVAQATAGASSADQAARGSLDWLVDLVSKFSGGALDAVVAFVAIPPGLIFVTTLAGILTFFFLRDGETGWRWATRKLAGWRRREVDAAGGRAAGVLGGYMIATGVISAFGAGTQFLVMAVLGIPLALPLAVLSFFGGFIPYIGSFITTGLAFLVTVAVGSPTDIAVMAVFTIVFNIVQGNFVAPLVYGRAVSIHPAVVLVAIPAGSTVAGVLGMFLVVPFIGVVVATWRTVLFVLGNGPDDVGGADRDGVLAPAVGPTAAASPPGASPPEAPAPAT